MERASLSGIRRLIARGLLSAGTADSSVFRSSPADVERDKEARRRRLDLLYVPVLRLAGFGLVALVLIPLHNLLVDASRAPEVWVPVAVGLAIYPLVAWLWLVATAERSPRFGLPEVFLVLDLPLLAVAVYFTGAEASWIFFLPLVRVADQTHYGFQRALLFAHACPLTYLSVLCYRLWVEGATLAWGVEGSKLAFLYAAGVYLSLTAFTAEARRRGMVSALRVAREVVRKLELESRRLLLSREELRDQVIRDPLTGLLNRKGILDIVERGLERSISGEAPFSIVLADLDDFKEINDRRGHAVGDTVLRWVSTRMLACGRAFDAVGRIGGDEFLIALPNCDRSGANKLAERIRRAVEEGPDIGESGPPVKVGISLGVATAPTGSRPRSQDLVNSADEALYRAKQRGGNRIELARLSAVID